MRLILSFAILFSILLSAFSEELPNKQEVLAKMTLANNYFLNKWPDPTQTIVTNKSRPSNLWTRGTYFEGLMQLYYITNENRLYQYAVDWGTFHKWQPTYTGTTPTRIADNQCCGQTYLELYQIDPKQDRIATMQLSIDAMVNSTKADDWWWIDALHMAMPVFTKFGNIYNDSKYYEKMYDLFNHTKTIEGGPGLYNPEDSLWYRDKAYLPPTVSPNGLPVYWSRGNGWVFAALTRTLDVLPENAPHRDEYLSVFKQMAGKLIQIQRTDGFWNCNLGDPNDYGGKETSGTVFYTFGLAWGINHNILDSAMYFPAVSKAWNGLVNYALHPEGNIGYVQSAGSKPADGQPLSYDKMPDFDDFALGGFLLAGSQVYRLAKDETQNTALENVLSAKLNVEAFPNPFSEYTIVRFENSLSDVRIQVINILGECVYSEYIGSNCKQWVWNGKSSQNRQLNNGLYFVNIKNSSGENIIKLILKK